MAYATRADLEGRFGEPEITALAGADDRVAEALADADAEINARLAVAYDLPLADGDYPQLKALACDLARYRLYDDSMPDQVRNNASGARRRLRELAEGVTALLDADGSTVARRAGTPRYFDLDRPTRSLTN